MAQLTYLLRSKFYFIYLFIFGLATKYLFNRLITYFNPIENTVN